MRASNSRATDPVDIRNWQRRDDRVTTSGKLSAGDPARLAAMGVRHVINLAPHDAENAIDDEAAVLAGLGRFGTEMNFSGALQPWIVEALGLFGVDGMAAL